ncbi:hypothetical protein [Nakamurella aerolata]|uniref:hypothetical protein n=1 Tax=Nakamurella aerolata TaxID=1656892 RepID=UPI0014890731|nr:hypothetical protein [Nakamurella aerolata]
MVKTPAVPTGSNATVVLDGASAVVADPDYSQARVSMDVPKLAAAGTTVRVPVTFTNSTGAEVTAATATVTTATAGVTAEPVTFPTPIAPGASATVQVPVKLAAGLKPQRITLTAQADYTAGGSRYRTDVSAEFTVPYADLAQAYSNNGVTDAGSYSGGNLDGSGNSLAAEQLAAAGVQPGEPVAADGLQYTWPAVPPAAADNVPAAGQTISVSGSGNTLGLLGTGIGGNGAGGQVTLHYSDGTTSTGEAGYPNWCCTNTNPYDATLAATSKGRYTQQGLANTTTDYKLFSSTVHVAAGKELVAVTLPGNSGMHVFAIAVGNT